jgi:UDP-glucose 4-epimerase
MKKGKILFTGGNGFIGRQIVPLLEQEGWEIVRPRSHQVRLEVTSEVDSLFNNQRYDAIIHGAIVGGRREIEDGPSIFYTNMNMFENIFRHIDKTDLFINLDSGASYGRPAPVEEPSPSDFGQVIPSDKYGFSKYCIAKRVLDNRKGINLRIFGCFGPYEEPSRFFNTNINNYINGKDIQIFKDRKIDFIYANDLYKIISYFLRMGSGSLVRDVNCVYNEKYYLSEIAEMINNLDGHNVNIIKQGSYVEYPYCGSPNNISCIEYDGLEKGIRDCYEYYK